MSCLFLFLPLRLMWSSLVGRKLEHTCNAYIVKSNLGSKESWVIQSNQDVHVCGIYGGYIWRLILILLCFLKAYLSFETWKQLLESRGYLIHLFFSGEHLSTHCFRYLGLLSIFSQLFFFIFPFFMNNFCIAPCHFSATKL